MPIKIWETVGAYPIKVKNYVLAKSGGKIIVDQKKVLFIGVGLSAFIGLVLYFLMPAVDHTYYRQTSQHQEYQEAPKQSLVSAELKSLFSSGKKKVEADKKAEAQQKQRRIAIKYVAPQIVGEGGGGQRSMRQGQHLIAVLKTPIDTRALTLVRALLPRGGEAGGVEIEPGSVLVGNFNYSGDGDRIFVTFSRLDPPDGGEPKKISAAALDAGTFTAGLQGEAFTGGGDKIAASIGLDMFSAMTDTMTERESLGNSFNGVQAKSSMRNGLLQGLSKASQDQASRTASQIEGQRGYVIVPEGKEMIVELLEDYR